jgi:mRNA interferase HigB
LREFGEIHGDAVEPLMRWFRITKAASWDTPAEARADFRHADFVGDFTVFNVAGNKYRLVVQIEYLYHTVYVRHVLTHDEYSKGKWKV